MRTAKTVSITLPPELLVKAQAVAHREHRTMSELFREALRRYMTGDEEWNALRKRLRVRGKAMGIESESDVERLSDEYPVARGRADCVVSGDRHLLNLQAFKGIPILTVRRFLDALETTL